MMMDTPEDMLTPHSLELPRVSCMPLGGLMDTSWGACDWNAGVKLRPAMIINRQVRLAKRVVVN